MNRRDWLLLAITADDDSGLSPVQLQRSLFLVSQKREKHIGPGFYEFELRESGPFSKDLYVDLDALVAAGHVMKKWQPGCPWSVFRSTDISRTWAKELRPKAKKEALSYLEEAVAWVKQQTFYDLAHKTPTIRVVG